MELTVNIIRHSTIGLSVASNITPLEHANSLLDAMPRKAHEVSSALSGVKFNTTATTNVNKFSKAYDQLEKQAISASKNIVSNQNDMIKSSQHLSAETGKSINGLRDNLKNLSHESFTIRPKVDMPDAQLHTLHTKVQEADHKMPKLHLFRDVAGGTMAGNLLSNAVSGLTGKLKEGAAAGFEYDKSQQKMNATWTTLTGNAGKAQDMVNTINDLSVKTGQANDTVDELEQGFYHLHSNKKEADDLSKSMLNMSDAVGLSTPKIQAVTQDMVNGLSRGKANNGMLNQISQYFPMFREQLAKYESQVHHGKEVTVADLNAMAKSGQISSQDIENVFNQLGSGKYNQAADNMLQTMYGMQRTIHARVPALIGEFENPIMTAKNPFYGAISKWVSDKHTEHEFKLMGQATTKGIDTITGAFGKAYHVKNGTKALDDATTHITHGIDSLSNGIAKNAPQIKDFFSSTKTTGVESLKLLAGVTKDVSAVALPLLHFAADHSKQVVPFMAGLFITKKVVGFATALTPVIGMMKWIRSQFKKPVSNNMANSMMSQAGKMQGAEELSGGTSTGGSGIGTMSRMERNASKVSKFDRFASRFGGVGSTGSRLGKVGEASTLAKNAGSLGKFGKFAKFGGASLAGVNVATSAFDLIGMNNKNRGSKIGSATGSLGGAVVGGLLGSLAGPAGTAIGSGIGSATGEWLGKHAGHTLQTEMSKQSPDSTSNNARQRYFAKPTDGMQDKLGQANANFGVYKGLNKSNKDQKNRIINENKQLYASLKKQVDDYSNHNQSKAKQDAKILSKYSGISYKSILSKDKSFYKDKTKNANSAIQSLIKAESKGGKGRASALQKANKNISKLMAKGSSSQKIILGRLSMSSKRISDKQASTMIKQSYRAFKGTSGYANKIYHSSKTAANKKYKATMDAANREYFVTGSISKKQYRAITKKARDQKNDTISNARKQRDNSVDAAQKQHDKVVKLAKKQTKDHLASVDDETGGMLNQWQQAGKSLESTWSGIASWWSKNVGQKFKWIGETADKLTGMNENKLNHSGHVNKNTGKREMSAAEFRKAEGKSLGGYAKGTTGALKRSQTALVNEFGQESAWNPSKGTFRFLGNGRPMLAKLHAGEHIFTAKQTRALTHGGMHGNFKAYAGGTGAGNAIDAKITNPNGLTKFSTKAKSVWDNLKTHTKSSTQKISANTQSDFDNMKSKTLDKLSSMHTGVTKNVKSLVSDFNNIIGKLTGYTDDAMKGVTGKLNKGFNGINSSLGQFGGNKSILKPIHYANGSNGVINRNHLAILNDAMTGPRQEAVVRNNKLLYPSGKNAMVALRQGDQVLNGHQTKLIHQMSNLAHYAKGSGVSDDKLEKIAKSNSDNPSKAWTHDFANQLHNSNGSSLQKGMTNSDADATKSVGLPWYKSMWGFIQGIADGDKGGKGKLSDLVKKQLGGSAIKWLNKHLSSGAGNPTGTSVLRWKPIVTKVLGQLGLSTAGSMVSKVLRQIQTESGGNPHAIGGTDGLSDGRAMGLMQVKPGTFSAYSKPGLGNWSNGNASIYAGLNYAQHRYGKDLSFLGQGHGYANGGWSNKPAVFGEVQGQPEVAINPQRKSADNLIMSAMHARDKFTGGSFSKRMVRMLKFKNGKNERHNLMQKALSAIKSAPNHQAAHSNKVEVHIGKIVVQGGNGNIPQNIGAVIAQEVQKALENQNRKTISEMY
ncbi:tape measure protein [Apilactobacillus micheneri]|uniref:tape measure protein n=1 Tax=Apilactobacillus micheneri TaxID=1899430 RepID=UPI000D03C13C|nr:tape measure protein [Apilactobacillus micheneri]